MGKIQEKAKEFLSLFKRFEKDNKVIWAFSNEAFKEENKEIYEKMNRVIWDLNGGSDFVFEGVVCCLDWLSNSDYETIEEARDDLDEEVDNVVDVYTSDLTSWLNENNNNVYYLTEALEEYDVKDGFQALALAQYKAIYEIYEAVLNLIKKEIEKERS